MPASRSEEGAAALRPPSANALLVALLAAAALVVLAGALLGRLALCPWADVCGPTLADDTVQTRLDTALPAPQRDLAIYQSFTPAHDGLAEVELLLVRYGGEAANGDDVWLRVDLRDGSGHVVASETLPASQVSHNQTYTLRFPAQPHSAGQRYEIRLVGSPANHLSAWGYSADVYDDGQLVVVPGASTPQASETPARELRFVTRYALTWSAAVRALLDVAVAGGGLLLAALLLLPLPGVLLLLIRPRRWDGAAAGGAALALGVASWPILWYWASLAGMRWSGVLLWALVAAGWAAALAVWLWRWRRAPRSRRVLRVRPAHALLALLILASLAARFLAVRDLAFPPWVDSSRHALITAVMVNSGQTPSGYAPYLPIDRFPYHFGFHTLSASLVLMTGADLPAVLLYLGQLLNGLLPLAVYAAGWMVTRRRGVGLLAAFLVALPFFFPAYYATWGRMTQLAAMVIMPVLLALTWRLGRGWRRAWPLVAVLAAGLFLVHFRVFLFFLPFAALAFAVQLIGRRRPWPLAAAAALAVALVGPRLIELLRTTEPLATVSRSLPGYNEFPTGYFTTGWERLFVWAAAVALVFVVGAAVRGRRWAAFPLLLAAWVGSLFLLLAGERLGLPETLVVNLNSMVITLFLPLSLFLAITAGAFWHRVACWRRTGNGRVAAAGSWAAAALAGLALGLLILFGWRQQIGILNPQTILALPGDRAALAWAGEHLPPDARVAVNSWQWLGATWAAADGGAWLLPLTGLATTTPPVDYTYNAELFHDVIDFNTAASAIEDWGDPAAAEWLRSLGVTHVFVGARGGFLDPAELLRNPAIELLFRDGGAFIFAVTG